MGYAWGRLRWENSLTWSHGTGKRTAAMWVVRDGGTPEGSIVDTGAPSVTPSGGTGDYLILTGYGDEGEAAWASSQYPADYTLGRQQATNGGSGGSGTNTRSGGAAKQENGSSFDPAWGTDPGANPQAGWTLVIPYLLQVSNPAPDYPERNHIIQILPH